MEIRWREIQKTKEALCELNFTNVWQGAPNNPSNLLNVAPIYLSTTYSNKAETKHQNIYLCGQMSLEEKERKESRLVSS